jgi:hypothetical protein
MLTHIGALVGCHCGNPRDPQIVAEGLFSREPAVRGDKAPGRKVIRRTICPRKPKSKHRGAVCEKTFTGRMFFSLRTFYAPP